MKPTKLFISHAHEDKKDFVAPLAHALRDAGYDVWYDDFVLTLGDSLLKKISDGLRSADFGIVVLSKHFFKKDWPQAELDGLFALQSEKRKVILPIWKDITKHDVEAFSPIIAGTLATSASNGVTAVVNEINRAVKTAQTVQEFSGIENIRSQFQVLDAHMFGTKRANDLSWSEEGVKIACDGAKLIITSLTKELQSIEESSATTRFHFEPNKGALTLSVYGPCKVKLWINYHAPSFNSITDAGLLIYLAYSKYGVIDHTSKKDVVRDYLLKPTFDQTANCIWKDNSRQLTTEQLIVFILSEFLHEIKKRHAEWLRDQRI